MPHFEKIVLIDITLYNTGLYERFFHQSHQSLTGVTDQIQILHGLPTPIMPWKSISNHADLLSVARTHGLGDKASLDLFENEGTFQKTWNALSTRRCARMLCRRVVVLECFLDESVCSP
jgi:hypothetical protein